MTQAIVVRGRFNGQQFVPSEPLPAVEGNAELIVYPAPQANAGKPSIFDLFGKASKLRSAEEIDAQIREEREAWGER